MDISVNHKEIHEQINVKIGSLLTEIVSKDEFIAYSIYISNKEISEFTTSFFNINSNNSCIFKKNDGMDLLLLCNAEEEGKYSLGNIPSQLVDNISVLYQFNIEESQNFEEFDISENGTKITSVYPLTLDFSEEDTYNITFETKYPERLYGIKLNEKASSDLKCNHSSWYVECIIEKSHFNGTGDFHIYHTNHKGTKTISYEASLIHVIMEKKLYNQI